ncbi:hypothetical protein FJU31_00385 [Stenotrophomonas cyclobalanopsidis]|uniref:Cardiolipin synthase N-terminal domain-containing protein n=1 Tax=Stenotrophomonas cyclobalanopsidis TaxID=2771362 RepID=A0ABQ6T5C7_9GAMM|nr:hypothetical protein FJU31_00385 [Stenotrophomonas cyclobalanopsidis]
MRAADKAWTSIIVLVAGIALLPGLLYLLGLALVDGRPRPARVEPSRCSAASGCRSRAWARLYIFIDAWRGSTSAGDLPGHHQK